MKQIRANCKSWKKQQRERMNILYRAPLLEDILRPGLVTMKIKGTSAKDKDKDRKKRRAHNIQENKNDSEEEEEEEDITAGLSAKIAEKILKEAEKERQEEEEEEDTEENLEISVKRHDEIMENMKSQKDQVKDLDKDDEEIEKDMKEGDFDEAVMDFSESIPQTNFGNKKTLNEIILEKIEQKQNTKDHKDKELIGEGATEWENPKVVEVYTKVGFVLSKFRGNEKIPKAVRFIPFSQYWEELLFLTRPENWTDHAYLQMTKIFIYSTNEKISQRYLNLILLPKIRISLKEKKKLNDCLYTSLKKSCYRPGAFYKGMLLPLCSACGKCTLREAVTFGSIVQKMSISVPHSAAALLRLADMPYTNPISYFIRVILAKRYALPYKAVDGLVEHFVRFEGDKSKKYPIVWYESLLVFLQIYKGQMKDEDMESLRSLIKKHQKSPIVIEIKKELNSKVVLKNTEQDLMDID